MIRILVTFPLIAKTLEWLNEIPEFEVSEKAGLTPEQMLEEISQADALICGGSPPVTKKVLEAGKDLKLIIPVGTPLAVDKAAARRKRVEVRPVDANGQDEAGAAIAILKDFFNV